MSTGLLQRHRHDPLRRPRQRPIRLRLPPLQPRRGRHGQAAWKTICALPSPTGTPSPGRAATRSAARPSSGPGSATRWSWRKLKADVAFEMFPILGVPYLLLPRCRRAPRGRQFRREHRAPGRDRRLSSPTSMEATGVKLLWGTANLFTHRRFMAGRRDQPRPGRVRLFGRDHQDLHGRHQEAGRRELRAVGRARGLRDAAQHRSGARAASRLGRMLQMVVDYKHKIGFKGTILIEPKPQEPTKHQYDYDVATVYGFLKDFGLEDEVQGEHRAGPRDSGRPHASSMNWRWRARSASSARST